MEDFYIEYNVISAKSLPAAVIASSDDWKVANNKSPKAKVVSESLGLGCGVLTVVNSERDDNKVGVELLMTFERPRASDEYPEIADHDGQKKKHERKAVSTSKGGQTKAEKALARAKRVRPQTLVSAPKGAKAKS